MASSRACPSNAASREPSSRRLCRASGEILTVTSATTRPMMTTTTRTSTSVNPAPPPRRVSRAARRGGSEIDIGIRPFAAGLAVGAEAEDVDLAAHAWIEVQVLAAPGVLGYAVEIAALLPVARARLRRGSDDERLQALLGRRVHGVVEPIELQRLRDRGDVGLRGDHARLVRTAHHLGHDDRGEQAEDHDDDHDLDQGEAERTAPEGVSHR